MAIAKELLVELRELNLKQKKIIDQLLSEDKVNAEEVESVLASGEKYRPIKNISDFEIENKVLEALKKLGIPAHIKGYRLLITAISIVIKDVSMLEKVTTELYPIVAKIHNTTSSRAERAIRHAIETSFERADMDFVYKVFGETISKFKGKPTNSEFIAMVADNIRRNLMQS